ncbi:hypothetical protein ABL78_0257 [Leptomonas seymouri]|uniref:Phosphatidylinositol N-acetylglucosaminyltransferase subunit H conserved domain-containing protein n=1 Tax=Leptomonas seymouri TaxID=5684 RepID=A0A0N1I406_LEPSE|nr:hypothetical protein ABL78_0257 [Leptomonas seymouri]|eukprot:KPI90661.1 hypothetical protein ABL78_0257 [Leptomonas seymouri]
MQSRRSKVVPDPLVYPGKATTTTAGNDAPLDGSAATNHSGVQQPSLFRVASPSTAQPSTSLMGGVESFSPGLNVYRSGGVAGATTSFPPKTTVLVDHHVTNTGAVVRLEQVDYSKAMRAYRVCRQEGGSTSYDGGSSSNGAAAGSVAPFASSGSSGIGASGSAAAPLFTSNNGSSTSSTTITSTSSTTGLSGSNSNYSCVSGSGHSPAPWSVVLRRLFGAADMLLLAIAVSCVLVLVSRMQASRQIKSSGSSGGGGGPSHLGASAASASWIVSLLAHLVGGRAGTRVGTHGLDGLEGGALSASERFNSNAVATCKSDDGALVPTSTSTASASYTQATRAAAALDTSVTLALFFFSVVLLAKRLGSAFTRVYVEEVFVMRGVGLQFTSYGIFNTLRYKVFVDLQMLRSLVIHDAFFRYQPIFYLSSSVENRAERMVYFPDTLPRLAVLRPVLNGIRGVLYGELEEGPSLAELEECWNTSSPDISEGEPFTEDSFA